MPPFPDGWWYGVKSAKKHKRARALAQRIEHRIALGSGRKPQDVSLADPLPVSTVWDQSSRAYGINQQAAEGIEYSQRQIKRMKRKKKKKVKSCCPTFG